MAIRPLPSVVHRPLAGLRLVPGYLDRSAQERLRDELTAVIATSPAYTPRMPKTGNPMSVRMTNCGPLGWVTDERGYRYQPHHPETGEPWPPIPEIVLDAWRELAGYPHPPGSLPGQRLWADRPHGPAPGPRRAGLRRPGGVAVARRHLPVSHRRDEARRPDPFVPPRLRRRRGARRARRGSPSTASTASCRAPRRCCPPTRYALRRTGRPGEAFAEQGRTVAGSI